MKISNSKKYFLSNRGGVLVEFVLCTPVICLFMYGFVYLNSYFDKAHRMEILARAEGFSDSQDQSNDMMKKDFKYKKDKGVDESRFFNDKAVYREGKLDVSSFSKDVKGNLEDHGYGRIISETVRKVKDKRMEVVTLSSIRKEEDEETVEGMAYKYIDPQSQMIRPGTMINEVYSVLDTGFLDDKAYNDLLTPLYFVVGSGTGWGSRYIDNCMMNFKFQTDCNGTNHLFDIIVSIKLMKLGKEISTKGAYLITEAGFKPIIDPMIDSVMNSVITKVSSYFEDKLREIEFIAKE